MMLNEENQEIKYSIRYHCNSVKIGTGRNQKEICQKINGDYLWVLGLRVTFFFFTSFGILKIICNKHILLCIMRKKVLARKTYRNCYSRVTKEVSSEKSPAKNGNGSWLFTVIIL